ncbi:MAG TPA: MraY family glycosyltransferase [Verrucomicrobiae bacterium]|nr:MraY family glycosyltransferase [Verrucomicrobiae bacterium]
MSFPWNLYVAAVLGAAAVSALSLPLWRRWCLRTGLMDDPGHRKIHEEPIPLAGGLAVATGLIVPTLAAALFLWLMAPGYGSRILSQAAVMPGATEPTNANAQFLLRYGLNRRALELGGILAGALGMLVVGFWDDRRELSPAPKFLSQFLVALLVAASGARITLFVPNPLFHYAVTILWVLTVVNAFNFMDNMNGLCTGLGAIGAWFFATIASLQGQYLVGLIAFLTLGSLIGFLPFNFPRAKAFLGDAGSHMVGYLLAVLAILPHFYTRRHPHRWAVLIPLLVLAVPLADMVWVVLLRSSKGKPFYVGDTNHLSHRLVRAGLSRTKAVLTIWILALAIGALSYLLL